MVSVSWPFVGVTVDGAVSDSVIVEGDPYPAPSQVPDGHVLTVPDAGVKVQLHPLSVPEFELQPVPMGQT